MTDGGALAGSAWWAPGVVFLGWSARISPSPQAKTAASTAPAQNVWPTVLLRFTAASNEVRIPDTNQQETIAHVRFRTSRTSALRWVARQLLTPQSGRHPRLQHASSYRLQRLFRARQAKIGPAARASRHIVRLGRSELQYFNRPPAICQGSTRDLVFQPGNTRRERPGNGASSRWDSLPSRSVDDSPQQCRARQQLAGSGAGPVTGRG